MFEKCRDQKKKSINPNIGLIMRVTGRGSGVGSSAIYCFITNELRTLTIQLLFELLPFWEMAPFCDAESVPRNGIRVLKLRTFLFVFWHQGKLMGDFVLSGLGNVLESLCKWHHLFL